MLAQWISHAAKRHFAEARREALITLGSAPLDVPDFRAAVLGQLGNTLLDTAIETDLAGEMPHARVLDADTTGPLRDIHRRVGTAILFESSGGQVDKVAHLPELRFALGEPNVEMETTTIDNAAAALEKTGFFMRKVGTDGFRIHHQATLKKVVSDRRASLDEESDIKPAIRKLVESEFADGASLPLVRFPEDGAAIEDRPRLTLAIVDPETEWTDGKERERLGEWTRQRGKSPRLYPGSLVWCVKKPGRELREKVEHWLAWQRVDREVTQGVLGPEYEKSDLAEVRTNVKAAQEAAKDEVWGSYRYAALADSAGADGLKVIDLGAGHSSSNETLCGRIVGALKSEALLNESVGSGYIDRHWPPAFKESGAWPLSSLRQSFLDGSLTRLMDPDEVLRKKVVEFVGTGAFGLTSGPKSEGGYERLWHGESVGLEEVTFDAGVFLLTKTKAEELRTPAGAGAVPEPPTPPTPDPDPEPPGPGPEPTAKMSTIRLRGTVPPEIWNRLGIKLLPKLRAGEDLKVDVNFSVRVGSASASVTEAELRQVLADLNLDGQVEILTS